MHLFFGLIISNLLFAGCMPANNQVEKTEKITKTYSSTILKAYRIESKSKIIYDINISVPSYCYSLKIDNIIKLQREKKIKIEATLNYKKGFCAQSIKHIKLNNMIDTNIDNSYDQIELKINNTRTDNFNLYRSKIDICTEL